MIQLKDDRQPRRFKASRYWSSNVWGATVAGIGGGLVLSIVAGILLVDSEGSNGTKVGAALILTIVATFLAMFPGNMIATVPVAVELNEDMELCLIAPLKRLYIPLKEVREVRDSTAWEIFQQGSVVKLNKRYGLMKSFVIHWAFGTEGKQLVRAIQEGISERE